MSGATGTQVWREAMDILSAWSGAITSRAEWGVQEDATIGEAVAYTRAIADMCAMASVELNELADRSEQQM